MAKRAVQSKSRDQSNMFCDRSALKNEATVEQFFVNRLLAALGYSDTQIKPKSSLEKLTLSTGSRRSQYKPDYALVLEQEVRWIVEAKGAEEDLDQHISQCSSYCLELNRRSDSGNPVSHFVLTNGIETRVYEWDRDEPILVISFEQFTPRSSKWRDLLKLLGEAGVRSHLLEVSTGNIEGSLLTIRRVSVSEINSAFAWCHRFIYRRENMDYSAAFMEFVKIIFLKILSDRRVHESYPDLSITGEATVPAASVRFSKMWIERAEADHPNPMDAIQFRNLLDELEIEVQSRRKKRIFDIGEKLNLGPDTIKAVTERLQSIDLFSIDSDLNGRLFETFLNATLRGKDLGQFFTPRSVVKLATRMARLRVSRDAQDLVMDACCGTGGFLIEALADMWQKVDENKSLSGEERAKLRRTIAEEQIYGVDAAKQPALARIARINMYLHGDGGSSIYQLDSLDKDAQGSAADSTELKIERTDFKMRVREGEFDVILTNPPFAKEYARRQKPEAEILDQYELAFADARSAAKPLQRLKSSVMFLERYHDLLKPAGRLVTVIDDSILGGSKESRIRDYLRRRFIVRAVISLPGDAFQRSQARVKTSILILEKKRHENDSQPPAFMYYCSHIGIDDVARQRVLPIDEVNRQLANAEIERVNRLYEAYLNGEASADSWIVGPEELTDRIDVKACLPKPGRNVEQWKRQGLDVVSASDLLRPVFVGKSGDESDEVDSVRDAPLTEETFDRATDVLLTSEDSDDEVTHLRVRYDGEAEAGDTIVVSDSKYPALHRVRTNDIVISHINAVHGAVAVVPESLAGCVVTNEYTVCRAADGYDPLLVWQLLRSEDARADLLLTSTGIGRSRISWAGLVALQLPIPPADLMKTTVDSLRESLELERRARDLREMARQEIAGALHVDNEEASELIAAFKPPR